MPESHDAVNGKGPKSLAYYISKAEQQRKIAPIFGPIRFKKQSDNVAQTATDISVDSMSGSHVDETNDLIVSPAKSVPATPPALPKEHTHVSVASKEVFIIDSDSEPEATDHIHAKSPVHGRRASSVAGAVVTEATEPAQLKRNSDLANVALLPKIKKKPRTSSNVLPQPPSSQDDQPEWYRALKRSTTRIHGFHHEDVKLQGLRDKIRGKRGLLEALHDASFLIVTPQLLRNHGLLHGEGLPAIFRPSEPNSHSFPYYLVADAEELYRKWADQKFDTDLMHGITFNAKQGAAIKSEYKRDWKVIGNNNLVNGQWWPQQICAVRDGAHGSVQGGIAAVTGTGVVSVVLAAGKTEHGQYPNVDNGDEVLYCGTDGKDGTITDNTQRMLDTLVAGHTVRLIRSSTCAISRFRPDVGFVTTGYTRSSNMSCSTPTSRGTALLSSERRVKIQYGTRDLESDRHIRKCGNGKNYTTARSSSCRTSRTAPDTSFPRAKGKAAGVFRRTRFGPARNDTTSSMKNDHD